MSPKEQPASREQRQWQDAVRLKLSNEAAEAPLGVPLPLVDSTDVNLFSTLHGSSPGASRLFAAQRLSRSEKPRCLFDFGGDFGATHRSFPL